MSRGSVEAGNRSGYCQARRRSRIWRGRRRDCHRHWHSRRPLIAVGRELGERGICACHVSGWCRTLVRMVRSRGLLRRRPGRVVSGVKVRLVCTL